MVDFKKRLGKKPVAKILDPFALYDSLDRASDKGPLRPVQEAILKDWHQNRRNDKDLILKLHTGQGKTLIGLLMLQSKLNETGLPSVYLCPNNFLIEQTCEQARQFGVSVCKPTPDLPAEFIDGKSVLVTSVQKLFNGLTKFGLGTKSTKVNSILMDDAHACIDAIRNAFRIRIEKQQPGYDELLSLFSEDLERQGAGTYADIWNNVSEAVLPVPYWAWAEKTSEVANILSKFGKNNEIKFAWPVIRDNLLGCHCVVSGRAIELAPYLPPLEVFGSYYRAQHRIFMSATITDDAFLIKGLRLNKDTIQNPLRHANEKWSGEKMILIPSLIDESLDRSKIVEMFAKPNEKNAAGIVALAPSVKGTGDWEAYGAVVADKNSISQDVANLKLGNYESPLVIVNRYDGIDLPDDSCRILVFDSKPYSECLFDVYTESCRSENDASAMRTARTIEQGLGRSVRGEKDYCVIILIGPDLIRAIRTNELRPHLSNQTAAQIQLGLEIVEMSREEIDTGKEASNVFNQSIKQCLGRDEGWKEFYKARMDDVDFTPKVSEMLDVFNAELLAEQAFESGQVSNAVAMIQHLIDDHIEDKLDRGWYLQMMARYLFSQSKTKSNEMQISAHKTNTYLLKPRTGMEVARIEVISQKRVEKIIDWLSQFSSHEELAVTVTGILAKLSFGTKANVFEKSLNELASAFGFESQRPDAEWGEGPDNLWGLRKGEYFLFECKSEVQIGRSEIAKRESEQMNRSTAWFEKYYDGCQVTNAIIIPTKVLCSAGNFLAPVKAITEKGLKRLKANSKAFFDEFQKYDLKDLSEGKVQQLLQNHKLTIDGIQSEYVDTIIAKRGKSQQRFV